MRNRNLYLKYGMLLGAGLVLSACGGASEQDNISSKQTSIKVEQFASLANQPPLPVEELMVEDTLEGVQKQNWVFAHDMNFASLALGRVLVFDPEASNRNFKGQIGAGQFASVVQIPKKSEIVVAETYYSRGTRGERTDVLSFYDIDTLMLKDELIIPQNNRAMNVTQKGNLSVSQDGSLIFMYTFTPASGVAVIDVEARSVLNHIDVPGCTMAYPKGERGVAMLCGDGGMIAFDVDVAGQVTKEYVTDIFHDIDEDPMFMKSGVIGEVRYWPTFTGKLQAIKLGKDEPSFEELWDFTKDADYLPSGWQVVSAGSDDRLYVLMRKGAGPGDHKIGGDQVWVLDPINRVIDRKLDLASEVLSIEITKGDIPRLIVTSAEMNLDVYDLETGERLRSLGGFLSATPFVLHASEFDS